MDISLALLPWKLIWGLQMKKQEKIGVAFAMSCGLLYVESHKYGLSLEQAGADNKSSSAGITAIVKTTKIESMLATDFCMPNTALSHFVTHQY
jgi:hypothetical protein